MAIGLRVATGVAGIDGRRARAPSRSCEQVLPSRLRPTVEALGRDGRPRRPRTSARTPPTPRSTPPCSRPRRRPSAIEEWLRFDYRGRPAARRAVPPAQLAAPLVPRRPRPAVGRVGRRSAWTGSRPGCRPVARSNRCRCPAATTPRSRCARSRRAAGTCTRDCASTRPPTRCSPASTRRSASSSRSTTTTSVLVTGADSLDTIAAYIGMLGMDVHRRVAGRAATAPREARGRVCPGRERPCRPLRLRTEFIAFRRPEAAKTVRRRRGEPRLGPRGRARTGAPGPRRLSQEAPRDRERPAAVDEVVDQQDRRALERGDRIGERRTARRSCRRPRPADRRCCPRPPPGPMPVSSSDPRSGRRPTSEILRASDADQHGVRA